MFWGMPELTEMIYLLAMRMAGIEAAAIICVLIGVVVMLGLLGYVKSKFNYIAAWTAIAALLAGGTLSWALSSGYVDWMSLLFGLSTLVALGNWLEKQDRRMLILAGIFCGGAIGTKYSAGVVLIGSMLALALLQKHRGWKTIISSIFFLGLTATITSSPWWIKNFLGTGNPFYPFFIPSGAMDQLRLNFYERAPVWRDWRSVVLLPWQATFLGISGKEGFSANLGALLVGLSPLAWINWKSRSETQRTTILTAGIITVTGFALWAIGSRISGLLIQTRLFFVFFPAWAVLAGAGIDAIWNLNLTGIRFRILIGVLAILMFGMNVFSLGESYVIQDPALYVLRLEDEQSYLLRNLGSYALAMETLQSLPGNSHVLLLWETRGYYCQPRCDSDEVIDRWFHDSSIYANSPAILKSWHDQGYTDLLIYNPGKAFILENDPEGKIINWSLLNSTLANLTVIKEIGGGAYTLYRIP
jgi:4-amino-4-deoxy-L-arabinose transferase-like glycosyltransferase